MDVFGYRGKSESISHLNMKMSNEVHSMGCFNVFLWFRAVFNEHCRQLRTGLHKLLRLSSLFHFQQWHYCSRRMRYRMTYTHISIKSIRKVVDAHVYYHLLENMLLQKVIVMNKTAMHNATTFSIAMENLRSTENLSIDRTACSQCRREFVCTVQQPIAEMDSDKA